MTSTRKQFTWRVLLGTPEGQEEVAYKSFWSPAKDFVTGASIAQAAAAERIAVLRQQIIPIHAELVG